jgi:hypothetical protein
MDAQRFPFRSDVAILMRPDKVVEHRAGPNRNRSYEDRVMAKRQLPSPEELRQLLRYEPETGKLFWLPRPADMFATRRAFGLWNTRFAGVEAFTAVNNNGYRHGKIFGIGVLASRVIWAMQAGAWPTEHVDHRDLDRSNNRWLNLRRATHSQNMHNQGPRKSTSGLKGVHWDKRDRNWRAQITASGRKRMLGSYETAEEAHAAYQAAACELHGEFARTE